MCVAAFGFVARGSIQGHYDELWALATHPRDHVFVTAGYDHRVTLRNTSSHNITWSVNVEVGVAAGTLSARDAVL